MLKVEKQSINGLDTPCKCFRYLQHRFLWRIRDVHRVMEVTDSMANGSSIDQSRNYIQLRVPGLYASSQRKDEV